jgi:hypothetical protein
MFVHASGSTYSIIDGVRRTKAAWFAGHLVIRATVLAADGTQLGECDLPIDTLLSRRDQIPRITRADEARWSRADGGAQAAQLPFPPILVQPGSRGKPIDKIDFDFGGQP